MLTKKRILNNVIIAKNDKARNKNLILLSLQDLSAARYSGHVETKETVTESRYVIQRLPSSLVSSSSSSLGQSRPPGGKA